MFENAANSTNRRLLCQTQQHEKKKLLRLSTSDQEDEQLLDFNEDTLEKVSKEIHHQEERLVEASKMKNTQAIWDVIFEDYIQCVITISLLMAGMQYEKLRYVNRGNWVNIDYYVLFAILSSLSITGITSTVFKAR